MSGCRIACLLGVLAVFALCTAGRLQAGGGPSGIVVLYNPNDPVAVTIAARYQQRRGIPERNMVPFSFPASFTRTTGWDFIFWLRTTLAQRGIAGQVQGIALAGITPLASGQSTATGFSLQSFLYLSPNYGESTFPVLYAFNNRAYPDPAGSGTSTIATKSIGGRTFSGETYWPTAALGFPGKSGNSPREVLSFIDRWATRDGTKAQGSIYWVLNADIRSNMRDEQISDVAPAWRARGIPFAVLGDPATSNNIWVSNRPDVAGGVVGAAIIPAPLAGNTFLPGSWVDHVTSGGGGLNGFSPSHTRCSEWLRVGADGSSGAVNEPGAITSKFPHAHIHTHIRAGASMAEAYWLSTRSPAEVICLTDPLLQPWADLPVVTLAAPAEGATVSGMLPISVSAVPTGGKTLEPLLDLFVDGRRVDIGAPGESVVASRTGTGFLLNTATLSDGWHELRVAAYNADPVRSQREARVTLRVNNAGESITLAGPATLNPDAAASFTVTPANLSGVTSVTLQSNGRVLQTTPATIPVTGGAVTVNASQAPLDGEWMVQAVASKANGQQVWSAPFSSSIVWPAQSAASPSPSLGPLGASVRYFADTTGNFSWDASSPTAVSSISANATNGLAVTATNVPGVTITDYTKNPGFELNCWFFAPTDDWYEVGYDFGNGAFSTGRECTIGGVAVPEQDFVFGPRRLAPGWHLLRLRSRVTSASFSQWRIRVRGGASQDFAILRPGDIANPGTGNPVDAPSIASIGAGASPVTTTSTSLTANATIGGGTPAELAALTYHWMANGPGAVTFSATGTNAARTTTATFTEVGDYTVVVRVVGPAGAAQLSRTLTVASTPGTLVVDRGGVTSILRGESFPVAAFTRNQFGTIIPVTPAVAGLPTVQWSSNDPEGSFTVVGTSGERALFRSLNTSGAARSVTLTARGVNGRTGSATTTFSVKPDSPVVQSHALGCDASWSGSDLVLTARFTDPDDATLERYLSFVWSVVGSPPGHSLQLGENGYRRMVVRPSGPGMYSVQVTAQDGAGPPLAATYSFTVQANGQVLAAPNVLNPLSTMTKAGETITFNGTVSGGIGGTVTTQWQTSIDGGATWSDIAGATNATYRFGPVASSDAGRRFRQVATMGSFVTTSAAATLSVDSSEATLGFADPSNITIDEAAGTINVVVRRSGLQTGAVSATAMLYAVSAQLGTNYRGLDGGRQTSRTVSWADGDMSDRVLTLPIIDNAVIDGANSQGTTNFSLWLQFPTGGARIATIYSRTFTIVDNDNPGRASFVGTGGTSVSSTVIEGGNATLTVRRSGLRVGTLSVGYQTDARVSGVTTTAARDVDYVPTSGTLTWPNGDGSDRTITIPVPDNGTFRGDRTFSVGLTGTASLLSSPTTAVVTIQDQPFQRWQSRWWPEVVPNIISESGSFATHTAATLALGPVVLYRLNETSGTTVSGIDGSGSVISTGTLTNPYTLGTPGPRPGEWPGFETTNSALTLTASGSTGSPAEYSSGGFVHVGTAGGIGSRLASGFTISAFVKTAETNRFMTIVRGQRSGNNSILALMVNTSPTNTSVLAPNHLRLYVRPEGGAGQADFSVSLAGRRTGSLCDGQWHHIAVTMPPFTGYDTYTKAYDVPTFYFDGEPISRNEVRGVESIYLNHTFADFSDHGVRIGAGGAATPNRFFAGSLDEVAFFPHPLSAQEIAQIAAAGPQALPPAYTSPTADPNEDGVNNLLSYAFGLSPFDSSSASLPVADLDANYLSLSFFRARDAADLRYRVLASEDLISWVPIWSSVDHPYAGSDVRTVETVIDPVPINGVPRRFLKLEVNRQ